ncbi:MAG: amidohydrolase family protein [candidate division Zixibacteria bacterium]|nr:amidohydrolase family protein [candidate division Zixibacteria bacterium]
MRTNKVLTALTAWALVTAAVIGVSAHDLVPGKKQTAPVLLKGGDLYTVSHGVLAATDLIFENGRITSIGKGLSAPAGAQVVDVTGMNVYPGIIAANTTLGLIEIDQARATNDMSEVGSNNPDVAAHVAYNPDSEIPPTVRSLGITTALIVPQGGLMQGRSSLMNLDGWTKEDAAEKMIVGLHMNWPQAAIITAWWMDRSAEDQKKQMDENRRQLAQVFDNARAYAIAKKADPSMKIDSRWEAMLPVISGELPVFIGASDYRQIEQAVNFARAQKIKMILVGGAEAWKATRLLKENNIPVVLGPTNGMPFRADDSYDQAYKLAAQLDAAGIKWCMSPGGASWNARNLPFYAGFAAAFGLSKSAALRGITLSAAEILGVSEQIGSLDVGKKATLVVSKGDILDPITAQVTNMWIGGRAVDLDNKQTELYRKYSQKGRQ